MGTVQHPQIMALPPRTLAAPGARMCAVSGWDVLERHFDGLTAEEVDAELALVPQSGATPVAAASAAYLADHGGPDLDGKPEVRGDVHRRRTVAAARTLSEVLESTLTLDQAAEKLGISRSRLSHRLGEGTMWAVTISGRRRLPRWQVTPDGALLPGLAAIVEVIPTALHPLAVEAFMTTPRPDFDDLSPVDWLVSGGDPAPVVDWLAGMAHG